MLAQRIRPIQSRQNSRVKELRAATQKLGRGGLVALEGEHLIIEFLRSCDFVRSCDGELALETVFVMTGFEHRLDTLGLPDETEILSLAPELFRSAVSTETPQPIAALARPPVFSLDDVFAPAPALVVVAAGLQDPGNLGTLVRSAEAFGATGVVLLPGTVSLWNAKTLRASSGSAFRLPVVSCSEDELLQGARAAGVHLVAAVARHGAAPEQLAARLAAPVALLIGNEGAGLPPHWLEANDALVTLPCPGPTESLNAAVAGSVLLYAASRARTHAAHQRESAR